MVIMTAKLSKGKLLAALLILAALIVATIVICTGESPAPEPAAGTVTAATNADRVAFLSAYGWTVSADPVDTQQIRIPDTSSEVFQRYNELQKSQGFDLSQQAGQIATRYVYEILNYEAVPSAAAANQQSPAAQTAPSAEAPQTAPLPGAADSGSTAEVDDNKTYVTASAPIYATLLVCDDVVIGGDVSAADPTGIMHGFAKP